LTFISVQPQSQHRQMFLLTTKNSWC